MNIDIKEIDSYLLKHVLEESIDGNDIIQYIKDIRATVLKSENTVDFIHNLILLIISYGNEEYLNGVNDATYDDYYYDF